MLWRQERVLSFRRGSDARDLVRCAVRLHHVGAHVAAARS
jgi:hypothetical protein